MIQLIQGFKDVLPGEIERWQYVKNTAIRLFGDFGFNEIRIPVMERTELFARSIGQGTDIVEKEMYTLTDSKGRGMTLRPEATASIVRAYIQHKLYAVDPVQKFYLIGPMFRRERPQKGRYRQFYQIDAEMFGVAEPYADVQLIHILHLLMQRLDISDVNVHLNSLGCPQCRPAYKEKLLAFLDEHAETLCADCNRRRQQNPLRVLDCKVPGCREKTSKAPVLIDYLCEECRAHFGAVQKGLDTLGVPFALDKYLVRGLDYYTRTAFEIQTGKLGAQSAVAGGGRYDRLLKALGGPSQPAIGFAIGLDRLVQITEKEAADVQISPQVCFAPLGENAQRLAFSWQQALCAEGIHCEMEMGSRGLKGQMRRANRLGARFVVIMGDSELENKQVAIRHMQDGKQEDISLDEVPDRLRHLGQSGN